MVPGSSPGGGSTRDGATGMVLRCGPLLTSNAYPPCLRGVRCILVYSGCIDQLYPALLDREGIFSECAAFHACPESQHINMLGFKLAGIVARAKPEEVAVLTVDGSMHCIQLHYMLEELEKIMGSVFKRRHYVVEKGKVIEIPVEAVKTSRFLSKVSRLLA